MLLQVLLQMVSCISDKISPCPALLFQNTLRYSCLLYTSINATLAGVVENALSSPSVDRIYGSINGIQGVLTENLIDLKTKITNVSELDLLCQTPASALGSCRVKLKDPAVCADEYETIISVLRKYNIDCFISVSYTHLKHNNCEPCQDKFISL